MGCLARGPPGAGMITVDVCLLRWSAPSRNVRCWPRNGLFTLLGCAVVHRFCGATMYPVLPQKQSARFIVSAAVKVSVQDASLGASRLQAVYED